jgi:hypothetical protein
MVFAQDSSRENFSWFDYDVQWFSDGSGEWVQYNDIGEEIATGNW